MLSVAITENVEFKKAALAARRTQGAMEVSSCISGSLVDLQSGQPRLNISAPLGSDQIV